jgi:hypothetical protein
MSTFTFTKTEQNKLIKKNENGITIETYDIIWMDEDDGLVERFKKSNGASVDEQDTNYAAMEEAAGQKLEEGGRKRRRKKRRKSKRKSKRRTKRRRKRKTKRKTKRKRRRRKR